MKTNNIYSPSSNDAPSVTELSGVYSNELTLVQRLLLCPGEPYRSVWLVSKMNLTPHQADDPIRQQNSNTESQSII